MDFNKVVAYFDPYSHIRKQRAEATASTGEVNPPLQWIPQYLALMSGVFIEPYLRNYQANGTWDFTGGWGRMLFSAIIAIVIFPVIFRKTIDESKPFLVLVAPIFTAGLGWQTLAGATLKFATQ